MSPLLHAATKSWPLHDVGYFCDARCAGLEPIPLVGRVSGNSRHLTCLECGAATQAQLGR